MSTAAKVEGLRAEPGDRIVIRPHLLGDRVRDGEIVAVRGAHGGPPFVVRWSEDGRVSTFFPGSDASVEHFARRKARRKA